MAAIVHRIIIFKIPANFQEGNKGNSKEGNTVLKFINKEQGKTPTRFTEKQYQIYVIF